MRCVDLFCFQVFESSSSNFLKAVFKLSFVNKQLVVSTSDHLLLEFVLFYDFFQNATLLVPTILCEWHSFFRF